LKVARIYYHQCYVLTEIRSKTIQTYGIKFQRVVFFRFETKKYDPTRRSSSRQPSEPQVAGVRGVRLPRSELK
jgi:hypothetical protein